jgi:hypothetical protein
LAGATHSPGSEGLRVTDGEVSHAAVALQGCDVGAGEVKAMGVGEASTSREEIKSISKEYRHGLGERRLVEEIDTLVFWSHR